MIRFIKVQPIIYFVVIVVGDAAVGKTNLIYVFDKGRKPLAANPTIGV